MLETTRGGVLSIIGVLVMGGLIICVGVGYIMSPSYQQLMVDESALPRTWGGLLDYDALPSLDFHLNFVFPRLPCSFVTLGVLDQFGALHGDAVVKLKVKSIDTHGTQFLRSRGDVELSTKRECGSCYLMKDGCCNTCRDVRHAFKERGYAPPPLAAIEQCQGQVGKFDNVDEGCNLYADVVVAPGKGSFYIGPGSNAGDNELYVDAYRQLKVGPNSFNVTHVIRRFYLGSRERDLMDGLVHVQAVQGREKWVYSVRAMRRVVSMGEEYITHVTHYGHMRQGNSTKFPGVYFDYEVSPIVVQEKRDVGFISFLIDLVGVLGGVFALVSVLDRCVSVRDKHD